MNKIYNWIENLLEIIHYPGIPEVVTFTCLNDLKNLLQIIHSKSGIMKLEITFLFLFEIFYHPNIVLQCLGMELIKFKFWEPKWHETHILRILAVTLDQFDWILNFTDEIDKIETWRIEGIRSAYFTNYLYIYPKVILVKVVKIIANCSWK